MPELPDVETWKRYIDATALHQKIKSVVVNAPRMLKSTSAKDLVSALKGHAFSETGRHGKFLFVRFDDKAWLVLHFGMSGALTYVKEESILPERRKGGVCPRWGTPLSHIMVSGRTAYLCPRCQR